MYTFNYGKNSISSRKGEKGKGMQEQMNSNASCTLPVLGRKEIKSMMARQQNSRSQSSEATEPDSIIPVCLMLGIFPNGFLQWWSLGTKKMA